MRHANHRHQQGAVIVTVSLLMLFLLGFVAFALDFGKLFVVKTELQTAMDSCALAAAQELDRTGTAITRATNAGLTAGNMNKVNFQSATWSGKGQLVAGDITFKDSDYVATIDAAVATYAQCEHVQPSVQLWLMQAMGAFSGNTTLYTNSQNVMASAVAVRASAQSTCPLPVALKPKLNPAGAPYPPPDYGFTVGDWVTMITDQSAFSGGQIGWMSLVEGERGTNDIRNQLKGHCGIHINSALQPADSGNKTALVPVWNYRFGLYDSAPDFTADPFKRPDLSGYAYPLSGGPNVYPDFVTRRASNAACASTVDGCKAVGPFKFPGSVRYIAPSGSGTGSHGAEGMNRRIVLLPVIGGAGGVSVIDFACMLMLQPLSIPMAQVKFEYLGNASIPSSPCAPSGTPGGSAGPLVPTLVR